MFSSLLYFGFVSHILALYIFVLYFRLNLAFIYKYNFFCWRMSHSVFNSYKNINVNKIKQNPKEKTDSECNNHEPISVIFGKFAVCQWIFFYLKTLFLCFWWTIFEMVIWVGTRKFMLHVYSLLISFMLMKLNGNKKCQTTSVSSFLVRYKLSSSHSIIYSIQYDIFNIDVRLMATVCTSEIDAKCVYVCVCAWLLWD